MNIACKILHSLRIENNIKNKDTKCHFKKNIILPKFFCQLAQVFADELTLFSYTFDTGEHFWRFSPPSLTNMFPQNSTAKF